MSRPIDEKIAKLTLDNSDLKTKAQESVEIFATLSKDMANSANFDDMAANVEAIADRFSTTGIMFQEVVRRMTNSAIDGLKGLVGKALDPITELGSRRALNIEQAKFQFEGLGMDIEASMDAANQAVLGTAFGLDEAAVVAANFGATGMQAGDEMANALRGVAGVAAMSGSSFSDVGSIFSKVAGQGRVMGSDLLRLSSRGINAAATMAQQMGITESEVRELVTKGKISFEMFADSMNEAFGEHATKANETYTGSLSNMRAAFGRIGATFYTNKYENKRNLFNSLTPQINDFNAAITPAIEAWNEFATARNDNLIAMIDGIDMSGFLEGGGPEAFAQGLSNIFNNILDITGAIGDAWSRAFGGNQNGDFLLRLANGFERLTEKITLGDVGLQRLENTFGIFFTVLSWVTDGVKLLFRGLGYLIPSFDRTGDSTEKAVGGISNMVYAFDDWLRTSPEVRAALEWIRDGLIQLSDWLVIGAQKAWEGMKWLGQAIVDAWIFVQPYIIEFAKAVQAWIIDKWVEWKPRLVEFGELIKEWALQVWEAAKDLAERAGPMIKQFYEMARDYLGNVDWGKVLKIAGVIIALTVFYNLYVRIKTIVDLFKKDKGGVATFLQTFSRGITVLQDAVKAATIIAIAGAIGILAGSLYLFASLDVEKLINGMVGLGVAMYFLSTTFKIIADASKSMKGFSAIATIGAMVVAMSAMTAVIYILSKLEWEALGKGLFGLAGSLLAFSVAVSIMGSMNGKMGASAVQLLALSVSLTLLTVPLTIMSKMDWESLAKGLLGIGVALGVIAAFTVLSAGGWANTGTAVAVGLLAVSLLALTVPIKVFAMMDLATLAKGLGAMAVALAIVGVALYALPLHAGANAVALAAVAAAMLLLTIPLKILGEMELSEIGIGLLAIAGVLTIFTAAVYLIGPAGAVILTAVASALGALGIASLGSALLIGALVIALAGAAKTTGPAVELMITAFETFMKGIQRTMTVIVDTVVLGIELLLKAIVNIVGPVVETALTVVMILLEAMLKFTPNFIRVSAQIIIALIEGIEQYTPAIVIAALKLIVTFIAALAQGIADNSGPILAAFQKLLGGLLILLAEFIASFIDTFLYWLPGVNKLGEHLAGEMVDGLRHEFGLARETGEQYTQEFTEGVEGAAGRGGGGRAREAGEYVKDEVTEGATDKGGVFSSLGQEGVDDYASPFGSFDGFDLGFDLPEGILDGMGEHDFSIPGFDQLDDYSNPFELFDGNELGFDAADTTYEGMEEYFEKHSLGEIGDEELQLYIDSITSKEPDVLQAGQGIADITEEGVDSVDLSPGGTRKIQEYNTGVRHENPNAEREGAQTVRGTLRGINSVNVTSSGGDKIREFNTGVLGQRTSANTTMRTVVESARGAGSGVDFERTGRGAGNQIGGGMRGRGGHIRDETVRVVTNARNAASNVNFTTTGRSMAQGLANGMSEASWIVRGAAATVAQGAVGAARGVFRTQSPSRVFYEIGEFVSEGLALGIAAKEKLSSMSAKDMALSAIHAVENTAKDFKTKIFDEMELQPTITPVLDLSNIENKDILGDLNSMSQRRLAYAFNQGNRNLEGSQSDKGGDTITNEYHAHVTAYGNMPDSMIRGMADKLQGEFKRMADRKEMNRGAVFA